MDCCLCRTRVALIKDLIDNEWPVGIFNRVVNVEVDNLNYHQTQIGIILNDTYCVQCRAFIGWKVIGVTQQDMHVLEGPFLLRLDKLIFYEQNVDQDEDANGQDLGAKEQNADQDGGANNKQNTDDQDGGGDQDEGINNEQNTDDQDGSGDQDGGANNEQNTDEQDGGCCSCLM